MSLFSRFCRLIEDIKLANRSTKVTLIILAMLLLAVIVTLPFWFAYAVKILGLMALVGLFFYDSFKISKQAKDKELVSEQIYRIADVVYRSLNIRDRLPMVSKPSDFEEIYKRTVLLNQPNFRVFKIELFKVTGYVSAPDTLEVLRKHLQNRISDLWKGPFPLVIADVSDRGAIFQLTLIPVENVFAQHYADELLRKSEQRVLDKPPIDEDF